MYSRVVILMEIRITIALEKLKKTHLNSTLSLSGADKLKNKLAMLI